MNRDYYIEISIYSEPEWNRELFSAKLESWPQAKEFLRRLIHRMNELKELPKAETVDTHHYHYSGCVPDRPTPIWTDNDVADYKERRKDPSFEGTDNH